MQYSILSAVDSMHKEVAEKTSPHGNGLSPGSTRKSVSGLANTKQEISCYAAFYYVINVLSLRYAAVGL
jgi:hypothetical protein